jgi:hypothetical protein
MRYGLARFAADISGGKRNLFFYDGRITAKIFDFG